MPISKTGTLITAEFIVGDPKGNSWANPWGLDDVVAAGVGVVQEGSLYKFHELNIVIKGSQTYFKALGAILKFTGNETLRYAIDISSSGNLQFGEKTVIGSISQGCVIDCRDLGVNKHLNVGNFYGGIVMGSGASYNRTIYYFNADIIENSIITGIRNTVASRTWNVKNTNFIDCYIGIRNPASDSVYDNVIFNYCSFSMAFQDVTDGEIRNAESINAPFIVSLFNKNLINILVGCNFPTIQHITAGIYAAYYTSHLYIKEEFLIAITDINGNALENALVTLKDKNGTIIFSELTDVSGEYSQDVTRELNLLERFADGSNLQTITDYNPFTITISFGIMEEYEAQIEINEKTSLQIELEYPELYVSAVAITDCTQIGVDDGELVITATGGDGSYTYSINGVDYQAGNTFSGLAPGNYTVYVRDGEGTITDFNVTISQPIPEAYAETVLRCDLTEEVLTCDLTEEVLICELTE